MFGSFDRSSLQALVQLKSIPQTQRLLFSLRQTTVKVKPTGLSVSTSIVSFVFFDRRRFNRLLWEFNNDISKTAPTPVLLIALFPPGELELHFAPGAGASAAERSTQSHTWTEPSAAAESSVRGRSGCQTWEVTRAGTLPSSDCLDETSWPRCSNSGRASCGSGLQTDVS